MVTVTSPRVRQVAGAQLRYTRVRRTCPGWWTQRPASHTAAHPHSSSLAHSALGREDTEVAVVVVVLSVDVRVVSVVDVTIFVVVVVVGVVLVAPAATVKVSASVSVVVVVDVVGIVVVVVVAVVVVVVIVVVGVVGVTAVINNDVEVAIVVATEDVKVRGLDDVDVASEVDVLLLLHIPSEQVVERTEANLLNR